MHQIPFRLLKMALL
uniref:Uncharacterized protein n=1 Tax=Arundo donax TaxID=35708 RepID=A0A0A9QAA4_ARUDO